jgi:stringent starvation protein B
MSSDTSTKPYLIRAIHEWCSDNGYTPYLVVAVRDDYTQVPEEYVKNDEIVLNVAFDATKNLMIKNDYISFLARFGGVSREIVVPIGAVLSIFARETGDGMGFEYEESEGAYSTENVVSLTPGENKLSLVSEGEQTQLAQPPEDEPEPDPDKPPSRAGRPRLKIVK